MTTLTDFDKQLKKAHAKLQETLWKGPEEDGITFSLLSKFMVCKERFRLLTVEGLQEKEDFNHKLFYGNLWHKCEENLASPVKYNKPELDKKWLTDIGLLAADEGHKYPFHKDKIKLWMDICRYQFPIYVDHYRNHPGVIFGDKLFSEKVFEEKITLPSGRVVKLKGKFDSVYLKRNSLQIQENKTKGDIDTNHIMKQLRFDAQTMIYVTALDSYRTNENLPKVTEIIYNVVRRPLSGGKHSIVRHKPTKSNPEGETQEQFLTRLSDLIYQNKDHFFTRFTVNLSQEDINKFKEQFLFPKLEELCQWWKWVKDSKVTKKNIFENPIHCRTPYGIWNPLADGGATCYDYYLDSKELTGLEKCLNLFPELV